MSLELFIIIVHEVDLHVLDVLSCEAIFSVEELDNLILGGSHCAIILNHHILKCLDKPALDVAGFGSLDCSIDETLTASHGVEEELLRSEASQIAVFDEALTGWTKIVLAEVRQSPLAETEGNTLTLNILLPHTSHNLRDVKV